MKKLLVILILFSCLSGIAQEKESRYASDIRRFRKLDSISPPQKNNILFIGSSTFTMWTDVRDYFPGYPILNRAYGGSCLTDLIHDFREVVLPYHPKQVVIYCGENDFAMDTTLTAPVIVDRFKQLFRLIRTHYPKAKITYVSMKPSPSRWFLKDKYIEANAEIQKYLKTRKNTSYVNIWDRMLGADQQPLPHIFLEDKLHMNALGYGIWQKSLQRHLLK